MEICSEVDIMGLTVQDDKDKSGEMKEGLPVTERSAELEKKLRTRADREHLVQKNILPDLSTSPVLYTQTQQLQRAKNADSLQKKLRNRPERQDLMQMGILPDLQINIDPGLQSKQMQLKKSKLADTLNRKLASRPGPLELIQGRILEPKNSALAEMVRSVFETSADEKGEASGSVGGSPNSADKDSGASRRHSGSVLSPQVELSPPSKDLASPMQEGDRMGRKYSDSSSPAHSPGDVVDEVSSPTKGLMSPPSQFTQSYPPGAMQAPLRATQTAGILSSGGKCLSPSQARKKQQKQKYRKLRYHEYVPPSKNNGKGGKTNPKPHSKQETPYSLILQQQQLFLQLQVLQQQYPNGVLMQKLPDIVDSLSKSGKMGKGKATSPSGTSAAGASTSAPVSVPQVVPVEQPNRFQMTSIRFEELKVSDLKAACKEMGMIVSGKKAELVERLLEHNNGVLPVFALPESQTKDVQRSHQQFTRPMHPPLLESQVSAPTLSPPSPNSPIFKFPEDQNGTRSHMDGSNRGTRKGSLSGLSSMGAPQVIPAAKLQQQFDELVERQKMSYICQGQAPKSLAPRPELGDMVAIKFPCPVDAPLREAQQQPQSQHQQLQQQQPRSSKGLTLPRQSSDSKMVMSPYNKQSHSLPSSPKPLSPANSTAHLLGELMEDSSSEPQSLESSLQMPGNGVPTATSTIGGGITALSNSQGFPSSASTSSSVTTSTTGLPPGGSFTHSNHPGPVMAAGSYYQPAKQPLRPSHSIPLGGILPSKMHPPNPPPPYGSTNSALMHRSMSLTSPYSHNMPHHRLHSAASFGSDNSDLITPPELHKQSMEGFMFHDELAGQHSNPMDMPLETQMDTTETNQLSEIFSILEDTGGFAVPGQPPSYSSKHSSRQDSIRSDSIMLGSGMAYPTPNPPLSHQHKSNSDVCLLDSHKHTVNPPPYNCSGAMLGSGMSWLDQQEGGMLSEVSPVGNLSLSHSNPGSLPHEGFQMNFLDDLGVHKQNTSSASMNGFSHGETYLSHNLPTSSGLLFPAPDESQALLELGLSTS